jgi:hypothetical protein
MKMNRTDFLVIAPVVGALLLSASTADAEWTDEQIGRYFGYDEPHVEWLRHFRLGAVVGINVKAKFSMSGPFASTSNPGEADVGGVNHVYDDGFVKVDASGNDLGVTGNWGYQSASQVQGGRLFFHGVESFTASATGSEDSEAQVGLELAYGGTFSRINTALLGWEFGFSWLPLEIENRHSMPATATRITHSFDASHPQVIPGAPYQGTFIGPGALIGDVAQFEGSSVEDGTLSGTQKLDVSLYAFRLGPTLHWELHPRVAVAVSAGAAFGIVSGDLDFDETITFTSDGSTAKVRGGSGSTEFVYGGYIGGNVMIHIIPNGDLYVGFQYMPLTDAKFKGAGREATLDLTGGLYFSAGINWPF